MTGPTAKTSSNMDLNRPHPISSVLNAIRPIIGVNTKIKSARDQKQEAETYPLVEYIIHKEGKSVYDSATKAWRVDLVMQLNYIFMEAELCEQVHTSQVDDSLKIQAAQFNITGKIRSILQLMVHPNSLGSEFNVSDFNWAEYDFKLVEFHESIYFRKHGSNELTGAASLFTISMLDIGNRICCLPDNQNAVYNMLDPDSVSGRLLKQKIDAS